MIVSNMQICSRGYATIQPLLVHGHYQCQICKSNIDYHFCVSFRTSPFVIQQKNY